MSGLGRWFGWTGIRTCNVLTAYVFGTNVSFVSNSTICQQCNPSAGECAAVCGYVPLLVLRVRVLRPHLDRYVGRNAVLHITHALQAHVVDGRRLQVVGGVRLRKTEDFSQITAT